MGPSVHCPGFELSWHLLLFQLSFLIQGQEGPRDCRVLTVSCPISHQHCQGHRHPNKMRFAHRDIYLILPITLRTRCSRRNTFRLFILFVSRLPEPCTRPAQPGVSL